MAKFSQEFLRQMATPAFGQGMFTAAKQAAQLPHNLGSNNSVNNWLKWIPILLKVWLNWLDFISLKETWQTQLSTQKLLVI